jgi:uncharacterized protein YneF (UPF0154 family)
VKLVLLGLLAWTVILGILWIGSWLVRRRLQRQILNQPRVTPGWIKTHIYSRSGDEP